MRDQTRATLLPGMTQPRKPEDWDRWDRLHAHMLLRRDYFLTWDEGIIKVRNALLEEFGIRVSTPEDYLHPSGKPFASRQPAAARRRDGRTKRIRANRRT